MRTLFGCTSPTKWIIWRFGSLLDKRIWLWPHETKTFRKRIRCGDSCCLSIPFCRSHDSDEWLCEIHNTLCDHFWWLRKSMFWLWLVCHKQFKIVLLAMRTPNRRDKTLIFSVYVAAIFCLNVRQCICLLIWKFPFINTLRNTIRRFKNKLQIFFFDGGSAVKVAALAGGTIRSKIKWNLVLRSKHTIWLKKTTRVI